MNGDEVSLSDEKPHHSDFSLWQPLFVSRNSENTIGNLISILTARKYFAYGYQDVNKSNFSIQYLDCYPSIGGCYEQLLKKGF